MEVKRMSYEERQMMGLEDLSHQEDIANRINNLITKENEIKERRNEGMANGNVMENIVNAMDQVNGAAVNLGGTQYVVNGGSVPNFKGDFRGFDTEEATPKANSFVRTTEKGKAWYENHVDNASIPNNIPMDGACLSNAQGFSKIDLSMVTNDAVNEKLNFLPVVETKTGEKVALRFLPPYEDDLKAYAVLEINLPLLMNGQYCFTMEGDIAYVTRKYNVYVNRDTSGKLRPSVMGLLKSSQRYLGKIQATDKDGKNLTYTAKVDGKDVQKPSMVSHYCDSLYRNYDMDITPKQYAQIMSFVKARVEARMSTLAGC